MAMNKTRYLRKKVLDHAFKRATFAALSECYIALFSDDPTDQGSLTDEITEDGYARVAISTLMGDASLTTGIISNSADIEFDPAEEDWPQITHIGIMDASTSGNMLYHGAAVTSRIVENGDSYKIKIGQLTVQEL